MTSERKAKIVATIGPATDKEITIQYMVRAGMNVARLNFSHGTHDGYKKTIDIIRKVSKRLGQPICILQDLQGPKIRTGELATEGFGLIKDDIVTFINTPTSDDINKIPVDYPELPQLLSPGNTLLLDDGKLHLEVTEVSDTEFKAKVIVGGVLKSHKGINLPGANLDIPGFTEKDEEDLKFGLSEGVDVIAISFVKDSNDIARVKQAISKYGSPQMLQTPIIAKLERPEALANLDAILDAAEGVMVARGDLGVEMSPEEVPTAQKRIIQAANAKGKTVITATQMLESMINNPRPTRAEASDVANAIFDGSDAVMLSGETSIGEYPVETIQMMDRIIVEAEDHLKEWGHSSMSSSISSDDAVSITRAARELAHDLNVAAVAVFTTTGRTARLMAKARPRTPVLGFTPNESTYNKMALYWGVFPHLVPIVHSTEEMLMHVDNAMIASTPIKNGQQIVLVCGFPVGAHKPPNLALLHTVGEKL